MLDFKTLIDLASRDEQWILSNTNGLGRLASRHGITVDDARQLSTFVKRYWKHYKHAEPRDSEDFCSKPVEQEAGESDLVCRPGYVFHRGTGTYVIHVRGRGHVTLSKQLVDRMVYAYSRQSGQASTVNEIARENEIDRRVVVACLKALGITHDSEPFTDEEILAQDIDDLAKDVVSSRRLNLHQKIERDKQRAEAKDAEKWRRFQSSTLDTITNTLQDLGPPIREVQSLNAWQVPRTSWRLIMGAADVHWGLYSWAGETGDEYNREIARSRLFSVVHNVLSDVLVHGRPQEIILPVGNDFIHVDNLEGATTRGTPQDTDGTYAEIVSTALQVQIELIDLLRQVSRVNLVYMPGNHERTACIGHMLALQAYYCNVKDVDSDTDWKSRQHVAFGDCHLCFLHGDSMKAKSKRGVAAATMASESPVIWGQARHRYMFVGHEHREFSWPEPGVQIHQLPALTGHSRWEFDKGFVGNRRGINAYRVDCQQGLVGIHSAGIER